MSSNVTNTGRSERKKECMELAITSSVAHPYGAIDLIGLADSIYKYIYGEDKPAERNCTNCVGLATPCPFLKYREDMRARICPYHKNC